MAIQKKFRTNIYAFTFDRKKYLVGSEAFEKLKETLNTNDDHDCIGTYYSMIEADREIVDSRKEQKFSDQDRLDVFTKIAASKFKPYLKKELADEKKKAIAYKKEKQKERKDNIKKIEGVLKEFGGLPDVITAADLVNDYNLDSMPHDSDERAQLDNLNIYTIKFWYTERFGWCLPTLHISNSARGSNNQDRYYAVTLDEKLVRIGKGPHVLATLELQLTKKNYKKILNVLLPILKVGASRAHQKRDDISTSRANSRRRGW